MSRNMLQSRASWFLWLDLSRSRSQVRLAVSAAAERKSKMRDALLELEHLAHTKLSNLVPLDMKNMSLSHIIRGKYSSLYFTASYFQPGFPAWLQLIASPVEYCHLSNQHTCTERSTRNHRLKSNFFCHFALFSDFALVSSRVSILLLQNKVRADLSLIFSSNCTFQPVYR